MANERSRTPQQQPAASSSETTAPAPAGIPTPPATPAPPAEFSWMREAETFLTYYGWEKLGTNDLGMALWQDPMGSRERATESTPVVLPQKEGPPTVHHQITGAPIPWEYSTSEALSMQRVRNDKGQDGSPIQRATRLELRNKDLERFYDQVVADMRHVLKQPVPTKDFGNYIGFVRKKLSDLLGEAVKVQASSPESNAA